MRIHNAPIGKVETGDVIRGAQGDLEVHGTVTHIKADGKDYRVTVRGFGAGGTDTYYLPAGFRVRIERS